MTKDSRTCLKKRQQELAADKRRLTPIKKLQLFGDLVFVLSAFIGVHRRLKSVFETSSRHAHARRAVLTAAMLCAMLAGCGIVNWSISNGSDGCPRDTRNTVPCS